jgi:hypothetical protein
VEFLAIPIPLNGNSTIYERPDLAPLPDRVYVGDQAPPVYRYIATLPSESVIVELPLGEPAFDVRYMFYSTGHWRALVNGYSGGAPADYELLDRLLQDAATGRGRVGVGPLSDASRPERAWQALLDSAATHAVVHQSYYAGEKGAHISDWLQAHGARAMAAFGADRVFQLR